MKRLLFLILLGLFISIASCVSDGSEASDKSKQLLSKEKSNENQKQAN